MHFQGEIAHLIKSDSVLEYIKILFDIIYPMEVEFSAERNEIFLER